jgi:ribosomal protein S18 acetylase RimI-like enzyme
MTFEVRTMQDNEAPVVAGMVHGLARDLSLNVNPALTGQILLESLDLVDVVVAAEAGKLLGACLSLMTFSTFRGARGIYVVDLFVDAAARNRNIGEALLRETARRGKVRGAKFVKLEVDLTNAGGARFYERLGFKKKLEDRLFILEQDGLNYFIAERETP